MRKLPIAITASAILLAALPSTAYADTIAFMETNMDNFGTVNLDSGAYTQISTNAPGLLSGLAELNGVIYSTAYLSNNFYVVNPSNGALSQTATTSVSIKSLGATLTGLYGIDVNGGVYSISTSGVATAIGSLGLPTGVVSSSIDSLSTNSNTLYLTVGSNLYTVNTSTGAATLVGGLT